MEGKDEMKTEHSWEQSTETFQLKEQKPSSFQTYPTLTENSGGSTITKYSSKNPGSHSHYEAHNNHKEPSQQETKPSLALLDKVSEKYIFSWFLLNIGEKYGGYTKIIAIRDFFQLDRSQCSYSSREAFPCESDSASKQSFYKPKSVHKLRPGDLDVVAGLGDGLVAASGALSSTHGES